ncbi:MAG: ATPase [Treponema sp.]|nr:ATPase [Candidatus Treponema equifaecale]
MARTTPMRLVELMVLKQDIASVLEFLGKKGNFQFQDKKSSSSSDKEKKEQPQNIDGDIFDNLQSAKNFLGAQDITTENLSAASRPTEQDRETANKFLGDVTELTQRENRAVQELNRVKDAFEEAKSFANLKVAFSELDHLSFLSLKIGKIDPKVFDELKFAVGERAVIIALGEDKSRVLAASSKKARFSLDTELKNYGFVPMEIPQDFKGIPDDVLESLGKQLEEAEKAYKLIDEEKHNMAVTHQDLLTNLLASFAIGKQITEVQNKLEATSLVYRITGWIPESYTHDMMKDLDKLTAGRTAIRIYQPREVPAVINGTEQVPVRLKHGKLVGAFERMIFSYGSPVYGAIDPTPFVALFFTLLFGIMFGDAGQGLVFLLMGILMAAKIVKVGGWNKFAPIFMAIGCSSMIMGLLNGEFFGNETLLEPFSRFVTGLFGEPRNQILHLMPNEGMASIVRMFIFFGVTVGVGFFINSIGLIINIANNFILGKPGKAVFGKNGISGSIFFWYVIVMAIRIAAFGHSINAFDGVFIVVTLLATAFAEPLIRLTEGHRPVFENGLFVGVIEGIVEVLETVISYMSNTISFVRVGAFGLAHAVLGFIIMTMTEMAGPAGIVVMIVGNGIVVVLEGMIVAIQVIRLQYYEFFSKFFNETGREFAPFCFEIK